MLIAIEGSHHVVGVAISMIPCMKPDPRRGASPTKEGDAMRVDPPKPRACKKSLRPIDFIQPTPKDVLRAVRPFAVSSVEVLPIRARSMQLCGEKTGGIN